MFARARQMEEKAGTAERLPCVFRSSSWGTTHARTHGPADGRAMSSTGLFNAIAVRDEAAALAVLGKGVTKEFLEAADQHGHTTLNYACATGFSEPAVLKLIDAGADVTKANLRGTTPLMHALFHPYSDTVYEALVRAGADVNYQNPAGCTAMHVACMSRSSVDRIKLLVKLGANINIADKNGHTPLITAVRTSMDYTVVDYIASVSADVNAKADNDPKHAEWTALHFAASLHNPGLCATLIKRGADIEAVNWAGNTPLLLCDEKSKTAMNSAQFHRDNNAPGGKVVRKPGKAPAKSRPSMYSHRTPGGGARITTINKKKVF